MLTTPTNCENFVFVRLNWVILLRFENCHFNTPFPLSFKNCESGFCSIVDQTPTLLWDSWYAGSHRRSFQALNLNNSPNFEHKILRLLFT